MMISYGIAGLASHTSSQVRDSIRGSALAPVVVRMSYNIIKGLPSEFGESSVRIFHENVRDFVKFGVVEPETPSE